MATAFGKVILLGEHAVVYGVPAIAAGLTRGSRATAVPSVENRLFINRREITSATESNEARAFGALLTALGVTGVRVDTELDLPSGMGLGASACLGVAIASAVLADIVAVPTTDARVLGAVDAWERVFHGNPSGVDAAAAYYGGCLSYTKGVGIKPLGIGQNLTLVIGLAGTAASTKKMVEQVANIRRTNSPLFEKTLHGIALLVENAIRAIAAGDLSALGGLLDQNQVFLSNLDLSTPALDHACELAKSAGALGAKLTGSGGGGAVVALTTEVAQASVLECWRSHGIECFPSQVLANSPEASQG